MAFDLGALMPGAQTDMNARIASALAGQGANPQPTPGGPPSPQNAQGGPPPQTPAQTYAPDPQVAQTTGMLLQMAQRDQLMNNLGYDLRRMGASFGTAQQQHDAMASLGAPPQSNSLGQVGAALEVQKQAQALTDHNRFMSGADLMGQQLLNLKPGQGAWLATSGQLPEILGRHFAAMEPTEAVRSYTQTRNVLLQQPGMTPDKVDQLLPPQSIMLGPNASLEDRQYLQYAWAQQAQGKTPVDIDTYKAQHLAAGTAMTTQAKDVQEFKDTATQDYSNLKSTYDKNRQLVTQLQGDMPSTMQALQLPDWATTGKTGVWSGVDSKVRQQAIAISQIKAGLTGASLANTKNVRNVREFNTLGQAVTAGLDPSNGPEGVQRALQDIQNKNLDAQATAEMTVGHKLTGELVGHGNRDLLNPSSPYYNGATEEARTPSPAQIQKLRDHPERAADFDELFGQGAAAKALGQ